MSTTAVPDRFTTLPDEHALQGDRRGAGGAWGAANVIFVAGAQKLVPTLAAAHERICTRSLPLEDARAQAAYGQHSQAGKILEIHTELPGRIHVVLIRQPAGF